MDIKEYKCPNCGGAVKFDSGTQKMKCPFCDTEFEIAAIEEYQKQQQIPEKDSIDWDGKGGPQAWEQDELDDLSTGSCPSCGAELLGDKNTAAMVCPNCGNSQIVLKRLAGLLKPEYLIPFKLDKKAAVEALKDFYKGKQLLPNCFKEENRVNSIQGVYLPFWLFDANAQGNVRYKATRTMFWSDTNYNYTKTDHYSVVRGGSMKFEKIPVDGSERMDDSYMDAIEPFDYTQLKDFQTAFLSGYLTEKYDVDAEKSKKRAVQRIKSTVETEFARSVTGYMSVRTESSTVGIEDGKVSYSLLPVWILNTKYNKENYLFLMNGQSGRLVGKLPADPGKSWKYRLFFTGIIGAALTLIIQALRIFL
jgi:DNA-directed RNA polymerase subunit RPC12/RpoP